MWQHEGRSGGNMKGDQVAICKKIGGNLQGDQVVI